VIQDDGSETVGKNIPPLHPVHGLVDILGPLHTLSLHPVEELEPVKDDVPTRHWSCANTRNVLGCANKGIKDRFLAVHSGDRVGEHALDEVVHQPKGAIVAVGLILLEDVLDEKADGARLVADGHGRGPPPSGAVGDEVVGDGVVGRGALADAANEFGNLGSGRHDFGGSGGFGCDWMSREMVIFGIC